VIVRGGSDLAATVTIRKAAPLRSDRDLSLRRRRFAAAVTVRGRGDGLVERRPFAAAVTVRDSSDPSRQQ
jgi:hypothetical protein